jgi:hypothetical protein
MMRNSTVQKLNPYFKVACLLLAGLLVVIVAAQVQL